MSRPYALSRAFAWAAAVLIYLIMRLVNLIVSSVCHRQGLACHWRLAHSVPRSSYRLWRQNGQGRLCHLTSNPTTVKAFPKTFPTEMKPRKFPAKEKQWDKKSESRGEGRKRKANFKAKSLLSAHARTLESDILHLEKKTRSARPINKVLGIRGSYM